MVFTEFAHLPLQFYSVAVGISAHSVANSNADCITIRVGDSDSDEHRFLNAN